MAERVYTHGVWKVREGEESAFLDAYRAFADHILSLEGVEKGRGALLQRLDEPRTYYSFGPWTDIEHVKAMRGSERGQELVGALVALCDEATAGPCRIVMEF